MKAKIFLGIALLLFVILFVPRRAVAQVYTPPDSCLKMIWPNDYNSINNTGSSNPDSIRVDSCFGSPTFGRQFAKKYYAIGFNENYYPFDTILTKNDIKEVADISNKHLALKQILDSFEIQYGNIYFKGLNDYPNDSIFMLSPSIIMFFEKYQDYKLIVEYFSNSIDSIKDVEYDYRAMIPDAIPNDITLKQNIKINPNPAQNYIDIEIQIPLKQNKIQILTTLGIIIYESGFQKRIDVSGLINGLYFLKIENQYFKFIKL